jgi:hypothetical protein
MYIQQTRRIVIRYAFVPIKTGFPDYSGACSISKTPTGSGIATGIVLSQQQVDDNAWHPIAFLSKVLNPVERNYKFMTLKCWLSSEA